MFELYTACQPIDLVVGELPADADDIGLSWQAVADEVESRLRSARVYGTSTRRSTSPEFDRSGNNHLYVLVHVFGPTYGTSVVFFKSLYDYQTAAASHEYRTGVASATGLAATWSRGDSGMHDGDPRLVLGNLSETLDSFLDEFLGVNGSACLLRAAGESGHERQLDLIAGSSIVSGRSSIPGNSDFVDPILGHGLHRWVVKAESGSQVTVLAESDDLDVVLYAVLEDEVLYSDDDGTGTNAWVELVMPASEQVDIFAGRHALDDGEGEYRLHVGRPASFLLEAAAEPRSERQLDLIAGSSIVSGRSSIPGNSDFVDPILGHGLHRWVVKAESGSQVTVLAESDDLDVVLYAVLEDEVLYSDDDGTGTNAWVELVMPASEQVDIFAGRHALDDGEGEYRLHVGRPASFLLEAAAEPQSERQLDLTSEPISKMATG